MKLLIFSDSHGDVDAMSGAVETEKPGWILHLGDCADDARQIAGRYPRIPVIAIPGNTDSSEKNEEWARCHEIGGRRFLLTHGHTFRVAEDRDGIRNLALYGFEQGADIILFGHTHEPYLNCCNGKWIMNPGFIGRHPVTNGGRPTYGVLTMANEFLQWRLAEVSIQMPAANSY